MEALMENQKQLMNAIEQLVTNFKKDGASRKTPLYIKKKLQALDSYWQEFERNHLEICKLGEHDYTYFVENHYSKTKAYYEEKRQWILQHLQAETKQPSDTLIEQKGTLEMECEEGQGSKQQNDHLFQTKSQGNNSKLDEMLRKQMANFKAFRRTAANINLETMSDKWEFEDVLRSLQSRWSAIDSLHWELDSELCEENKEYEQAFNKYEQQYNDLKKGINKKMWAVSHREKSTPQLDIPIFSGNFNQWVSFKDLFNEAIHNNPSLSQAQKMQFLKSKVRGEAERLIQHLPISTDNYLACWELLNHRYNNKKLIFTSHMNILLSLPNMQQQSMSQIKKMHDITLECLHAIKNLGVDVSSWDPILVHLLSQKLDAETYGDYIQSLTNSRELPVLQEFLDFMESKFMNLESSRRKQDNVHQKTSQQPSYNNHSAPFIKKPQNNFNNYNHNYNNNGSKTMAKSFHVSGVKCPLCSGEHGLYNCKTFLEMPNEQKLKTVNKLKVCSNCLFSHNGNRCISTHRCRKCSRSHNTILHEAYITTGASSSGATASKTPKENIPSTSHVSQENMSEILLATAIVRVKGADGAYHNLRSLIDQGSQISIMTERAAQLLGNKRQKSNGTIFGVGERENNCKGMINIECASLYNDYAFTADVFIMNNLIKNLPNKTFMKPSWSIIQNINLADPEFFVSRPVDILFGADIYSNIMLTGIIKGEDTLQPIAQQTQLGWLLCGNAKTYQCNVILNNLDEIKKFWEVEEISEQSNLSVEDQECITLYTTTTKRQKDGRYVVKIPFEGDFAKKLGSSKQMAIAQFLNLERKFEKHPQLAYDYKTFMSEYFALNHMKTMSGNRTPECFLPHHGIQRLESTTTKYRVVFNASAKTDTGLSLNDVMRKGPNLQQDLQTLILKWRQYQYAFTADIEKMYRQILIHEDDQHLQKIVWRDSKEQPLQYFQLATITYGTKSAPFLAMMTLKTLAADEKTTFPKASKVLEDCFYMDDLVHGVHSIEEGKELITDLNKLLKSGGFNLRKWASNEPEILLNITNHQDKTDEIFNFKTENTSKTLGLCWNSAEDKFTFKCNMTLQTTKPTKRKLLSEISKLFDPLGWVTPISTKLKLLFQKLWKQNLDWDDVVTEEISKEWTKIKEHINFINQFEIPRWIKSHENDVIQLHGFSDASENAYGCVVYAKIKNTSQITLISAKSKLVPNKKALTLPKLEISGAYLLAKLMNKIIQALSQHTIELYGWTDSMIVLGWINGEPQRWKSFVANRVQKITEIIPSKNWRYVSSSENPADAASRGMYVTQLKEHSLWWQGPVWLSTFQDEKEKKIMYTTDQETKCIQSNVIQQEEKTSIILNLLEKYSSFTSIVRIIAWILRALTRNRKQCPRYLTLHELRNAKLLIVKHVQENAYGTEMDYLNKNKRVNGKSKLLNLKPFIDQFGILRVGGRLENSILKPEAKHPIIIPHNSRLASLLIDQAHLLTFHGGPRLTLATLRQQYWVTGGNTAIKKQLRNCIICRKQSPIMENQLMGDLPEARCNPASPYYFTAVDYTGYMDIKLNKSRGARITKGYVAIFICMVTKAVHIELVSDLTSSAFLAALRRMAARRGAPRHIYSDCGTNFVGANRILKEEFQHLENIFNDSFFAEISDMSIEWHFNAPSWPSAGGLWERAVRSLKFHLRRVVGSQKLTFEEFATILAQIEACLNSRPLASLTEDINDLDFLTPAHFLIGRAGTTVIQTTEDARTRWQLTNKLFQDLWKKWKLEYLNQLMASKKWLQPKRNLQIGDLVVIQDENLPPGKWAMGRVIDLHPGKDGLVRVVTLKTRNGSIKRPVVKLSVLPINNSTSENKQESESNNKNKEVEVPKQSNIKINKPTRTPFANIAMAIILFMTLFTSSSCSTMITEIDKERSLYFDPLAKMQLIRDKWTLVVYYDMAPFFEGIEAFEKIYDYLNTTCAAMEKNNHCNLIVFQLQHEYSELKYYNELLLTQHFSAQTQAQTRRRRGLINGVGYLANSLFGVLDERFAEKYTKDIELLRKNQAHLNALWKNQTSVVEAEYNLLRRTEENIAKQHKIINKHLRSLDFNVNRLQQQVDSISKLQEFTLSAFVANNMLNHLKRIQESLIDTLTDIYHEQFDRHLLTPQQLKKELNIISGLLTSDITLPLENSETDLRGLYKLMKVNARMTEEYFIFEIKIPLISRDSFDLYHVIALPQRSKNSMISLTPIADHVAINLQKDSYLAIYREDLQNCMIREMSTYICYIQQPIYKMKTDQDLCIKDENNQNKCKINILTCQSKWYSLERLNTFIYFCCDYCQFKTLCSDQVTLHKITQTSIVTVEDTCVVKTDNFTIFAHKNHKSQMNIKPVIEIPIIAPINNIINLTIDKQESENQLRDMSNERIEKDIEEKLKTMKESENIMDQDISYHDIHHYTLIYGILVTVGLAGSIILWRRFCRGQPPALSATAESSQAGRALSAPAPTPRSSDHISDVRVTVSGDSESAYSVIKKHQGTTPVLKRVSFSEDSM